LNMLVKPLLEVMESNANFYLGGLGLS
jgi:hypothetical protein